MLSEASEAMEYLVLSSFCKAKSWYLAFSSNEVKSLTKLLARPELFEEIYISQEGQHDFKRIFKILSGCRLD